MKQLQDELLEREKAFWGAASDPDFFRNNMTEDGLAVIGGGVMTRADAVKSTGESPEKWTNIHFEDSHFVQISDDAAAVIYKGSADRGDMHYIATITSVYAKRDGKWLLALTTHAPSAEAGAKDKQPAAAVSR